MSRISQRDVPSLHVSWERRLCGFVLVTALATTALQSEAATIRVAQDGTGDHLELFDGVAAAADGDTVSVGPGVYDDMRDVDIGEIPFKAIAVITAPNVHLIGDDRDTVFIGPPGPPQFIPDKLEYGVLVWVEASGVSITDVTVQNVSKGIADSEHAMHLERVRVVGANTSVPQLGFGEARIVDCTIESGEFGVAAVLRSTVRDVRIERCEFLDVSNAVQLQGVNGWVLSCKFTGGAAGVNVRDGSQVVVERGSFVDNWVFGAGVRSGSALWIYNSDFRGEMERSIDMQGGSLYGDHNRLASGSITTVWITVPENLAFRDNHIFNQGALSVLAGSNPSDPRVASLAQNWWGTTDLEQIEAWIDHAPDDPGGNGLTVIYEPILDQPVPTAKPSMGRLKGRFRGAGSIKN